jgi:peptidoglycan/LPS O-acetylase OafA/YrhL
MLKIFNYKSDRLNGLDHLRAIAILLVMIFHFGRGVPSWLEPIQQIGWTGVDLFFVLSGYLIGFQLLKEYKNTGDLNFKRFYIKRFFRILPVYVAVLVLYYSLPNLREGSGLPPLWRFLTFTQNFGLDAQNQKSFSHAWSLCIEEQFYLLLPITIMIVFKFKIPRATPYLILFLVVIGFFFRISNWNDHVQPLIESGNRRQMFYAFLEKVYYPSYNRMDGLIIGVGIAAIFNFRPKIKDFLTKHGNIVLLIGLGLFLFAYKVCENFISYRAMIYGLPLISLAYGVLVIAAISPTCILYKFRTKFTLIIATLSYAIYLTHKQLYHLVKLWTERLGNESHYQWTFWLCIIVAILGGLILHLMVEKPFLRLRERIISRPGHNKR